MLNRRNFVTAAAVCLMAVPAFADGAGVMIKDAYMRSSGPTAKSGAAFMMIMNNSGQDDVLVGATSDIAKRIETHTHIHGENGVMMMREVEGGFVLPDGETHMLKRGGDHLMFMGLNRALVDGEKISVTLHFEKRGDMVIEIPVDLKRMENSTMDGMDMKKMDGS